MKQRKNYCQATKQTTFSKPLQISSLLLDKIHFYIFLNVAKYCMALFWQQIFYFFSVWFASDTLGADSLKELQ